MIHRTSKNFRTLFILEFTRQLIKNSSSEIFELKEIVEDEEKKRGKITREKIHLFEKKIKEVIEPPTQLPSSTSFNLQRKPPQRILRIPEVNLPERLQYLKPVPRDKEIDLGKLNPLIKNPLISSIECDGPDENLIAKGTKGTKKIDLVLTKQEINDIIQKFSKETRIPLDEGVFKVVFGRLILSAIVSEVVGSKFIIKKLTYSPLPPPKPGLRKI